MIFLSFCYSKSSTIQIRMPRGSVAKRINSLTWFNYFLIMQFLISKLLTVWPDLRWETEWNYLRNVKRDFQEVFDEHK